MLIYSLLDGSLIRVLKTNEEFIQFGAPDEYAYELEIDPDTNSIIVNHIDTAWNDTTLINTTLRYLGEIVPVNPPGQAWIERLRQEQADTDIASIPGYATWTADEMVAYIDANVVADESVKTVLKRMARMHAAERNKLWPNLEGS